MNKTAPLLPSLKEKRRYLVYEAHSEGTFSFNDVKEAILQEAAFLGTLGLAKAGLILLDDWNNNKGIIRVATASLDNVKAALFLIRNINKKEAFISTIGVSGTLYRARNKFIAP